MYIIAKLFNNSSMANHFISYKRPNDIIQKYGFQVTLVTKFPTSMHSSKEGHMCYIFRRNVARGEGAKEKTHAVCTVILNLFLL